MTATDIINRLEEFFGGNVSSYAYEDFMDAPGFDYEKGKELDWKEIEQKAIEQLGLGEIVEIDQYGGEGQGDTWYTVKHFVDHDIYIRTDGFYSSYNGTDFYDGFGQEVRPVQKTVTVFE